jgi:hypothetical protein
MITEVIVRVEESGKDWIITLDKGDYKDTYATFRGISARHDAMECAENLCYGRGSYPVQFINKNFKRG